MVSVIGSRVETGAWVVTWKFEGSAFEMLETIAQPMQFRAGARVFREDDPSDGMYLILEGTATIVRRSESGEERIVGKLHAGHSFGEIGLLVEGARNATIIASSPLSVLKITSYMLDLLQNSAPDICYMIYKALAKSMAEQLLSTYDLQPPE